MRINGTSINGVPVIVPSNDTVSPVAAPAGVDRASAAESALLQPAREAMAQLPDEIDTARVAELRDALARGEIKFDASRLAALIQRYHGGRA